ncbi:MAG: hypothetical protein WDW38_005473 [Sanguina aurantia]
MRASGASSGSHFSSLDGLVSKGSVSKDAQGQRQSAGTALPASPQEAEEEANSLASLRKPATWHHLAGMEPASGSSENSGRRSAELLTCGGNKRSIEGAHAHSVSSKAGSSETRRSSRSSFACETPLEEGPGAGGGILRSMYNRIGFGRKNSRSSSESLPRCLAPPETQFCRAPLQIERRVAGSDRDSSHSQQAGGAPTPALRWRMIRGAPSPSRRLVERPHSRSSPTMHARPRGNGSSVTRPAHGSAGAHATRGMLGTRLPCLAARRVVAPSFELSMKDLGCTVSGPLYLSLGVLPPDTPVPLALLMQLFRLVSLAEAQTAALALQSAGVLKLAVLDDGSRWGAICGEHVSRIQAQITPDQLAGGHSDVLSIYTLGGRLPLVQVGDDGYIMSNITHHCLGAGRADELRTLLTDPMWLEAKLHACGIGAIVFDFRRYLQVTEDSDVRLLLQAFQLSLSCCTAHTAHRMLREQMLARLMAVSQAGTMRAWYDQHMPKCAAEGVFNAGQQLVHLLPRTATLQQAGGKHRMTLRGHTGPIRKVVIASNGHDVITISLDGSAQVWDMNIGDCVMQLTRDRPLTDVAVSANGAVAVVSCEDGHCCIWDLTTGNVLHVLKGHKARVNAVAIDRQGLKCATVSDDGTMRVWGLQSGRCEVAMSIESEEADLICISDVAVSCDGTLACTVGNDFNVYVWDLDSEAQMHRMEGHSGWVVSVCFIGSTNRVVSASQDCTARVWDAARGTCLFVLEGHTGRLNNVTVDAGGTFAVTSSDDFTARVWELDTGACVSVLRGHSGWINDAAISRDGTKVVTVSGDRNCMVWNAATGACDSVLEGHSGAVTSVALTHKGRFAISTSDDATARVWDLQSVGHAEASCHTGRVKALRVVPGSLRVVSVSDDGVAKVWDPVSGLCTQELSGHAAALTYLHVVRMGAGRLRPHQRAAVRAPPAQQGSRVKCVAPIPGRGPAPTTACSLRTWSPTDSLHLVTPPAQIVTDSLHLGTGVRDTDPHSRHQHPTAAAHRRTCNLPPCAGRCADVLALCVSTRPAPAPFHRSHLTPWTPRAPAQHTTHLPLSLTSRHLGGGVPNHTYVHPAPQFGAPTSPSVHPKPPAQACVMTRDGATLVTASKDCTARIWDVQSCTCRSVITGHADGLVAVALSHNERLVATASYDHIVVVSRMDTGARLHSLTHSLPVLSVGFSPDGVTLGVTLEGSSAVLWNLSHTVAYMIEEADRAFADGLQQPDPPAAAESAAGAAREAASTPAGLHTVIDTTGAGAEAASGPSTDGQAPPVPDRNSGTFLRAGDQAAAVSDGVSRGDALLVVDSVAAEPESAVSNRDRGIEAVNSQSQPQPKVQQQPVESPAAAAAAARSREPARSSDETHNSQHHSDQSIPAPSSCELGGHTQDISALVFSEDGSFVATASADCTVVVWHVNWVECSAEARSRSPELAVIGASQVAFFMADASITCCCFAGLDSDILVVGDASGMIHFLDFSSDIQARASTRNMSLLCHHSLLMSFTSNDDLTLKRS